MLDYSGDQSCSKPVAQAERRTRYNVPDDPDKSAYSPDEVISLNGMSTYEVGSTGADGCAPDLYR